MSTLVSRGFGALARLVTRGFFSSLAPLVPTPDCYLGFDGKISGTDYEGNIHLYKGFQGVVTPIFGFEGNICED